MTMNMNCPILLMTAAVDHRGAPSAMFTPAEREKQYRGALIYYCDFLKKNPEILRGIVFCDNSGFNLTNFQKFVPREVFSKVEFIALSPDDFIPSKGKSYNEMLTLNKALELSRLMEGDCLFLKVTGRYPILNIRRIVHDLIRVETKIQICYSVWPRFRTKRNQTQPPMVETRRIAFRKSCWLTFFHDAYKMADNATGEHFETIVFDTVRKHRMEDGWIAGFSGPPLILGKQGHWKKLFGVRIPKWFEPFFLVLNYIEHCLVGLVTNEWNWTPPRS